MVQTKLMERPKDVGGGASSGTASQSASEPHFSPQIVSLASRGIKQPFSLILSFDGGGN